MGCVVIVQDMILRQTSGVVMWLPQVLVVQVLVLQF